MGGRVKWKHKVILLLLWEDSLSPKLVLIVGECFRSYLNFSDFWNKILYSCLFSEKEPMFNLFFYNQFSIVTTNLQWINFKIKLKMKNALLSNSLPILDTMQTTRVKVLCMWEKNIKLSARPDASNTGVQSSVLVWSISMQATANFLHVRP